jgi:transcriptional regulator with XRE-family HTH domain
MSERLKIHLGRAVLAARKRSGLTQEALAERIGRSTESVSNIERHVHLPTLETLDALGQALAMPVTEFFEDLDDRRDTDPLRAQRERNLRELARRLSDRDLDLVTALVEGMGKRI